jgi:hypothetical protein
MAKAGEPSELVTVPDLVLSNAFEIAALVAVLERKGTLTQREVLEEIQRRRVGQTHRE